MIKANELRVGNKVKCTISNDAGIYEVLAITMWEGQAFNPMIVIDRCPKQTVTEKQLKPISLTPEILISFGFEKDHTDDGEIYYSLRLSKNRHHDLCFLSTNKDTAVYLFPYDGEEFNYKYLHEIQNLYFALTKEELVWQTEKVPTD